MKKLVLLFAIGIFITQISFSQTVNDIPIKDIDVEYIQIVGTGRVFSNKVTIQIDFGQNNSIWTSKDTQVKNENGKKMKFNSMIDALNFFNKNGYSFVTAYTLTSGSKNVYHFLMKKKD